MNNFIFLVPLLILHFLILLNLRFIAWPEMLVYPYLISNGFDLYKDIAMPYQPLLPLFQSVYSPFGNNSWVLKALTWGIIIFCDILIFLISRKILGEKIITLLPLAIYIILQPLMGGNGLWFDLSLTPFVLLAIYSYLFFENFPKKLFFLSLFLSIASLIKQQTAIAFILLTPFVTFKLWKNHKLGNLIWYFLGGIIPIVMVLTYIIINETWSEYLFWTFEIPFFWYPQHPSYFNFPTKTDLVRMLLIFGPLLIVLTNTKKLKNILLILLIFLPLFLTSFTRFEYLRLQQALAVYVIILIFIIRDYRKYLLLVLASIIFTSLSLLSVNLGNVGQTRFYGDQEINLASQIKSIAGGQTVYLINLPSIIYLMANLQPPKPWVDNYVWYFESDQVQDKFISGLISNPPGYIFRKKPESGRWDNLGVYEPRQVLQYIKEYYHRDGLIGDNIEIWKINENRFGK